MTNAEQNEKAAQDGERECRQRTDDRALALVAARFLATHRLFFLLNLLQLAVCLTIFANFGDMKSRCAGALRLYKLTAALTIVVAAAALAGCYPS